MRIEITGEAEILIKAALASGKYGSAEEFIEAMAKRSQPAESPSTFGELPKHVENDTWIKANARQPFIAEEGSTVPAMEWTPADDLPARWEDDDLLAEAWNAKDEHGPVTLAEIHEAMKGVKGSLANDVCEERSERL